MMSAVAALLLTGPLAAAPAPAPAPDAVVRRLALLVGTNDGGPDRVRLRYASSDAQALGRVLGELGGVSAGDQLLLTEVNREGFLEGVRRLGAQVARARAAGTRTEALVYYSGHSDEQGLLLRGDRLGYDELRTALSGLPADVRIAILDSCASGTLARRKGGVQRPAFLVDASNTVRGQAILTSSSADEASQESDRIGGSFFTHNLVSGLRGAADVTGDGRVTLHEAYQFAFHETLARTEKTQAGAQHPAYDMELAGAGDLVMTDVRSTSAGLVLSEALDGRLYIRDAAGALAVELVKQPGRSMELGLAPGAYTVSRERGGQGSRAGFTLREGGRTPLGEADFQAEGRELTALRGGPVGLPAGAPVHRRAFLNFGILPWVETNALYGRPVDNHLSLSFGVARASRLDGLALALGGNWADGDGQPGTQVRGAQLAVGFNWADGDVKALQASVGLNHVGGNTQLGQLAVGGNSTAGGLGGVQAAVGYNVVGGSTLGAQGAVGFNVSRGSLRGAQAAVGANVVGSAVTGLQLAVGANVAGSDMRGLQAGVGANVVRGSFEGLQVASGVNFAGSARGMQLGLVNVGGDVSGLQLGLVNVASRVRGLQLGLINVAQESSAPIGMLSFVRDTQLHVEVFASDVTAANVGLKLGRKYVYSTVVLGTGRRGSRERHTLGFGLGAHVPLQRFFLDADLVSHNVFTNDWSSDHRLLQLRAIGGFELAPRLALIAGPTLNVQWSERDDALLPMGQLVFSEGHRARFWPGLQVGVKL